MCVICKALGDSNTTMTTAQPNKTELSMIENHSSPRDMTKRITPHNFAKASGMAPTVVAASVSLSPNLQSFINRLSTPKKKEDLNSHTSSAPVPSATSHYRRASTPQPSSSSTMQTSSTAGDLTADLVTIAPASSGISSAGSSAVSIVKKVSVYFFRVVFDRNFIFMLN